MSEEYSYLPPEKTFINDQGLFETVAPALLLTRQDYDRIWNEQRIANRHRNLKEAHGVYYKGTYYHNGVGQK